MIVQLEGILARAQKELERAYRKADHLYELICQEEQQGPIVLKRFWLKGKQTHYLGELYLKQTDIISVNRARKQGYEASARLLKKILGEIGKMVQQHDGTVSIAGLEEFSGYWVEKRVLKFNDVYHSSSTRDTLNIDHKYIDS